MRSAQSAAVPAGIPQTSTQPRPASRAGTAKTMTDGVTSERAPKGAASGGDDLSHHPLRRGCVRRSRHAQQSPLPRRPGKGRWWKGGAPSPSRLRRTRRVDPPPPPQGEARAAESRIRAPPLAPPLGELSPKATERALPAELSPKATERALPAELSPKATERFRTSPPPASRAVPLPPRGEGDFGRDITPADPGYLRRRPFG